MTLFQQALQHTEECLKTGVAYMYIDESKDKHFSQNGYDYVLHYLTLSKSQIICKAEDHQKDGTADPLLPPYPLHKEITYLGNGAGHYVFVNRCQVKKGHVVISSDNPSERQTDPLTQRDFIALSQVIHGYDCKGIAYFNCNVGSGCSQMHKHFQFAPLTYNPLFDLMAKGKKFPYKYFATKIGDYEPYTMLNAYLSLMESSSNPQNYNFMISNYHAVIVPRVRGVHECGLGINSLGVSGHILIHEEDEDFVTKDLILFLAGLCVPID